MNRLAGDARRASVAATLLATLPWAACASGEPLDMELDPATEVETVVVLGDGFVRHQGERIPREAFVVQLRLRTRGMTSAQRSAFRVELQVPPDAGPSAAADTDWLLDQVRIMSIGQARLR